MSRKRTLLIDGDILLYRFGFANQLCVEWEEGVTSEWEDPDLAVADTDQFIQRLLEKTECAKTIICFSGPSKSIFRYKLLASYKHNRQDKPIPRLYHLLKDHLHENYQVSSKPNLEADDCLGILATKRPGKYVVASIDKDLTQIPGWFFNWDKDEEPKEISVVEADMQFYRQCLSGDSVDGFSGVPGIGPKKAERIINPMFNGSSPGPEEVWEAILAEYEKKGLDEAYALTMARMARILRYEDWDDHAQEPVLWTPS